MGWLGNTRYYNKCFLAGVGVPGAQGGSVSISCSDYFTVTSVTSDIYRALSALNARGRPHANATAPAVMLLCGSRNAWQLASMAWHIGRQQDCVPDVQWRRGRLVSWPQDGRHHMTIVCDQRGTSWMKCMCALWGCATSYAYERLYVSAYYLYVYAQRVGPAANNLQRRTCPVFLISLLGGSRL